MNYFIIFHIYNIKHLLSKSQDLLLFFVISDSKSFGLLVLDCSVGQTKKS